MIILCEYITRLFSGDSACGIAVVENTIRTGFTSSEGHSVHALYNIASQFAANPSVVAALGFPITAESLNDLTMIHL